MVTTLTPQSHVKTQVTLWLEPDCYECDRLEWQSLWSMTELQNSQWHYTFTVQKPDGWYHRFHNQEQRLEIKAYDLWAKRRLSELADQ